MDVMQLRAPAPLPPQPVQGDGLSSLDKLELGRLLAANQALVQQQVHCPFHICPGINETLLVLVSTISYGV